MLFIACVAASSTKAKAKSVMLPEVVAYQWRMVEHLRLVGVNGQLVEYRYDGTVKTVSNWPTDSGFTQYELGSVRDITRLRGRYAWSKDGTDSWFITDLEDESHPDRYSAQYRAESQPDGIIGIGTWRDFIVCFGSSTIEYFSLTGATTVGAALYVAQPSLMVQKGIAGTYCKTPFADRMRSSAIRQQVRRLYTSSAPVRCHQSPARALRKSSAPTLLMNWLMV